MKSIIYYFTGTGNSLKIAKDLAEKLNNTELVSVVKALREGITYPIERVGLVFPVYYGALPPIVAEFIGKLNASQINYIFAVATCHDFAAAALYIVSKLLKKNNKKLDAGFVVKMPGNFIPMYGPPTADEQQQIFQVAAQKVEEIAEFIKNAKKNKVSGIGRFLAFMQKRNDRKFSLKDHAFRANQNCNSCGICQKICPVQDIEMIEGKPKWLHKCQFCLACLQWCPTKAIQFGKNTEFRVRYHHPDIKLNDLINN